MRILMTLTAAIIAATAVASSASAGTIGCDPGEADASINARMCRVFNHSDAAFAPQAYASARKSHAAVRRSYAPAPQKYYVPNAGWGRY
jgi:hypothetical protein